MAFSQKHSGKVFVPWFNTEEWRSVYNFLTSNSPQQMQEALLILKTWKNRTPLLSAGVEGTLLLLEAILFDTNTIPETQVVQIYSVALLRFLNICAANSNKQGTFNRTVSKNNLPKWLIDIRHDIAHNHRLPSMAILELALNHSLKWVIDKYWKVQNQTISDYVEKLENMNTKILDSLSVYIRLTLNLYWGVALTEYDEALMGKVNYLVSKRYNQSRTDIQGFLIILEEILNQCISDPDNIKFANKVAELLVDDNGLLATYLQMENEKEIIPPCFKKLWINLLNILYKNGVFFSALLDQLWLFITSSNNETSREIAAQWICDLLDGLLKLKALQEELQTMTERNHEQEDLKTAELNLKHELEKKFPKDCIEFEGLEKFSSIDLKDFENSILENANMYTPKFIDRIMKLSKKPEEYKVLMTRLVLCTFGENLEELDIEEELEFSNIKTVRDLPIDIYSLPPDAPLVNQPIENGHNKIENEEENIPLVDRRWILINDTSRYKNYPIGLLPP